MKKRTTILIIMALIACTQDDSQNTWDINWEPTNPISLPATSSNPMNSKNQVSLSKKRDIKAPYLLKTQWHQHYPFNKALPMRDGHRVVVGCVNIALAQMLYYYQYPLHGHGVVHHQWQGESFTAVLDRRLYWNKIPAVITQNTPDYAIDELAALIRDISMINHTQFGIGPYAQSGAAFDMNRFVTAFGFSREMERIESTNPNFFHLLDQELDSQRPLLVSIQGQPIDHMAIIDGKTHSYGKTLYHINMGWGGQHDRFYDLTQPITLDAISSQRSIGQTYRFTGHITLYYPIRPCKKDTCTATNLETNDQITGTRIQGYFDNKSDQDRYENILLKGPTVIHGDRGYANQAFYIQIYDRYHQLIADYAPKSKAVQYDFDPDIYHLTVSLCQNREQSIHCYELVPGFEAYDIQVNTGVMDTNEKQAISDDIGPPIIQNKQLDIILPRNFNEHTIRIDAFHPIGLPVGLSVHPNETNGIRASMNDHFLVIRNRHHQRPTATKLVVTAETQGIQTQLEFDIMFSGKRVWFGQHIDIPGEFQNQDDKNVHRVILENRCRLTGFNGFMNQAFYMQVLDKQGNVVVGVTDQEIERYFDRGIYQIQTSLKVARTQKSRQRQTISTKYYQYQKGIGDQYVIHTFCPDFDHDQDLLYQDNTDSPPMFQKEMPPLILGINSKRLTIPVDVIDPDGDTIYLSASSDHPEIEARVINNALTIIPHSPSMKTIAQVTVSATANQKTSQIAFPVFIDKHPIDMGKQITLKGIFSDPDDQNVHPVILSGDCVISGYNGFRNQAFFIEILDKNMNMIMPPTDYNIQNYFDGKYIIRTGLKYRSRFFPYIEGSSDQYTLSVSCPDMDLGEMFVESALWGDLR